MIFELRLAMTAELRVSVQVWCDLRCDLILAD